jgi:predicted transcriptional regulator
MAKDKGSDYFIPVWDGLITEEHHVRMGSAIWTYLLLHQLTPKNSDSGKVLNGKPLTAKELAERSGFSERKVRDDIRILKAGKYIVTERTSQGLIITITKYRKPGSQKDRNTEKRNDGMTEKRQSKIRKSVNQNDGNPSITSEVSTGQSKDFEREETYKEKDNKKDNNILTGQGDSCPPVDNSKETEATQTLLAEFITQCKARPTQTFLKRLGKAVKEALEENVPSDVIRKALEKLRKNGLQPSALPGLIFEIQEVDEEKKSQEEKLKTDALRCFRENPSCPAERYGTYSSEVCRFCPKYERYERKKKGVSDG